MEKIKRTDKDYKQIIDEFIKKLQDNKDLKSFTVKTPEIPEKYKHKIKVGITSTAALKMKLLVANANEECAWKGYVTHPTKDLYLIKDIYVYPQKAVGLHVESDDTAYPMWCAKMAHENPDVYKHLSMQGHSHVNAGATPSTTDIDYYEETINEINENAFYIFMILNKRNEMWIRVYDKRKNIKYTNEDIDVYIYDSNTNLTEWAEKELKNKVKAMNYNTSNSHINSFKNQTEFDEYLKSKFGIEAKANKPKNNKHNKHNKNNKKQNTFDDDIFGEQLRLGYDVFDPDYTGRMSDAEYDEHWLDQFAKDNK